MSCPTWSWIRTPLTLKCFCLFLKRFSGLKRWKQFDTWKFGQFCLMNDRRSCHQMETRSKHSGYLLSFIVFWLKSGSGGLQISDELGCSSLGSRSSCSDCDCGSGSGCCRESSRRSCGCSCGTKNGRGSGSCCGSGCASGCGLGRTGSRTTGCCRTRDWVGSKESASSLHYM